MNIDEAPIVVLGLGKDGKPRAAVFGHQDAEAAKRAVAMMGLKIGRAETPDAVALTKRLPQGKVFASGKGLLPFIKRDLLEKLLKLVSLVEVPASATVPASAVKVVQNAATPSLTSTSPEQSAEPRSKSGTVAEKQFINAWDALEPGAIILWSIDPKKEGYFPCIVMGTSKDRKSLVVRWRDFAGFKPFRVQRIAVGIISKVM